ncbi:NAD(P)-dependent oxidoreductase [Pandoraea sp. ISTKB]|uniref:NAD(P)-dependent oxidoreductase n=1 Tax=Pandoraea sp. ISTKB TaxID=1586708 RepID=UPI0008472E1A|nr:NAD(P)-dependent oxidoreductase [Pandoraea sp. ISTKB]ODP34231.1 3-hydroxyisobutyrate dehydrogenase [Pandoraea sp. ISTKB]
MTTIAFLGLGNMGRRMCARLIGAGYRVTVWNRTRPAQPDAALDGATWADTPKMAARGADFVITMLTDDQASKHVWLDDEHGALSGMSANAIAIESSTLSPDWVCQLGRIAAERGIRFIEAPVSGSLPQADAGQLVYLIGGDDATLDAARPVLTPMGAMIRHVGPIGCGALAKLATNTLLGVQVTALAEVFGLFARYGVDAAPIVEAMASTTVWSPAATLVARSIGARDFAPRFPVRLIHKDFGYMASACGDPASAPTISAAYGVFDRALHAGMGELHMTGVAQLFTDV